MVRRRAPRTPTVTGSVDCRRTPATVISITCTVNENGTPTNSPYWTSWRGARRRSSMNTPSSWSSHAESAPDFIPQGFIALPELSVVIDRMGLFTPYLQASRQLAGDLCLPANGLNSDVYRNSVPCYGVIKSPIRQTICAASHEILRLVTVDGVSM